jgi:hypothetical protein
MVRKPQGLAINPIGGFITLYALKNKFSCKTSSLFSGIGITRVKEKNELGLRFGGSVGVISLRVTLFGFTLHTV